jgi:CheY-like chemotaxis protein
MEHVVTQIPGLRLMQATDAPSGLRIAGQERPDLVIMDVHLPGMSGLDAVRELRRRPETCDLPVIALTAAASKDDIREGIRAGFEGYLTKPVDVVQLIETIREALRRGR